MVTSQIMKRVPVRRVVSFTYYATVIFLSIGLSPLALAAIIVPPILNAILIDVWRRYGSPYVFAWATSHRRPRIVRQLSLEIARQINDRDLDEGFIVATTSGIKYYCGW